MQPKYGRGTAISVQKLYVSCAHCLLQDLPRFNCYNFQLSLLRGDAPERQASTILQPSTLLLPLGLSLKVHDLLTILPGGMTLRPCQDKLLFRRIEGSDFASTDALFAGNALHSLIPIQ